MRPIAVLSKPLSFQHAVAMIENVCMEAETHYHLFSELCAAQRENTGGATMTFES